MTAEHVTETIKRNENAFVPGGIEVKEAPFLGAVTHDTQGIIQRIDIQELLPDSLREALYREAGRAEPQAIADS